MDRDAYMSNPTAYAVDSQADPDVLAQKEQVEQTRADLSETIDAIQEKLSPGNIIQGARDSVRQATVGKVEDAVNTVTDTAQQAAANVQDTAAGFGGMLKSNPGLILAGVGIGWTIFQNMKKSNSSSDYYGNSRRYPPSSTSDYYGYARGYQPSSEGMMSQAQGVAGRAQETVGNAQEMVGQATDQVQQAATAGWQQAQAAGGQVATQVQQQTQQISGSVQQLVYEQPFVAGAGALVLGMAVGMAIPETAQENQLLGPARESMMERASDIVQETVKKVEDQAESAIGSAQEAIQQSGSKSSTNASGSGSNVQ